MRYNINCGKVILHFYFFTFSNLNQILSFPRTHGHPLKMISKILFQVNHNKNKEYCQLAVQTSHKQDKQDEKCMKIEKHNTKGVKKLYCRQNVNVFFLCSLKMFMGQRETTQSSKQKKSSNEKKVNILPKHVIMLFV